ncbi:MAG: hypothetical protein ACD_11C00017G0038 [uncultured bacterium]|nr:MAG: hypothetical protein ACD_11C00017G0038 [uncultured bacterium]HBR71524.1 hypothetical protein [Candidatus Moranbacteria bacterium]
MKKIIWDNIQRIARWELFWSNLGLLDVDFSDIKIHNISGYYPLVMPGKISEENIYEMVIEVIPSLKCSGSTKDLNEKMKSVRRKSRGESYVIYVAENSYPASRRLINVLKYPSTTFSEELIYISKKIIDGGRINGFLKNPVLCPSSMIDGRFFPVFRKNGKDPVCGWRGRLLEEGCYSKESVRRVILP